MKKSIAKRIRLIKSYRLYSTKELSLELGVHFRTIQEWQKKGMKSIDPDCKPFLFRGIDAKSFLSKRRNVRKQTLESDEFYCTKCRRPVKSHQKNISVRALRPDTRFLMKGKCRKCRTVVNRFISGNQLRTSVFARTAKVADIRLYESQPANVNIDIEKGHDHE